MAAISTAIGWMIGVIGSVIVPVIILFVLAFVCFVIKRAWWVSIVPQSDTHPLH